MCRLWTRKHGEKTERMPVKRREDNETQNDYYENEKLKTTLKGKKRSSLHTSQVVHQAGAYPGFCSD